MIYPDHAANLDEWFPRAPSPEATRLGVVVGGSLSKGLVVKLDREQTIEELAVGRYVVVHGANDMKFFCMITDISLNNTNPAIQNNPPDLSDAFLRDIYVGTAAFGPIHVTPIRSIEGGGPNPVQTSPS
jgi:hypothetical protein